MHKDNNPIDWGNDFFMDKKKSNLSRNSACTRHIESILNKNNLEFRKEMILKLEGKTLGCHCKPDRCHAAALAFFANSGKKCPKHLQNITMAPAGKMANNTRDKDVWRFPEAGARKNLSLPIHSIKGEGGIVIVVLNVGGARNMEDREVDGQGSVRCQPIMLDYVLINRRGIPSITTFSETHWNKGDSTKMDHLMDDEGYSMGS